MTDSSPPTLAPMIAEEDATASNPVLNAEAAIPSTSKLPSAVKSKKTKATKATKAKSQRKSTAASSFVKVTPSKSGPVKKGDVIMIQFRTGPLWPALVTNTYPKRFTYVFFPLNEVDSKAATIFSASLKKEVYTFLAREDEPEATCEDPLLRHAFETAFQHCKAKNVINGSDLPIRPPGLYQDKIKPTKKKQPVENTSNKAKSASLPASHKSDVKAKSKVQAESSIVKKSTEESGEKSRMNEEENASKILSEIYHDREESSSPTPSELERQFNARQYKSKGEENDQRIDPTPELHPDPENAAQMRTIEDAVCQNFSFHRNHKLELDEAIRTNKRNIEELQESPVLSAKEKLEFAVKTFEMVRPIAEKVWQSESLKTYQPPDRDTIKINIYTAGYLDNDCIDDLFNILVKFVLSKDNRRFSLLTAVHFVCTVLMPEVLINVLMEIHGISRTDVISKIFQVGVANRDAANQMEKEPSPEKPKINRDEAFRLFNLDREALIASTEPVQVDVKEDEVEEESDNYRPLVKRARLNSEESDEKQKEEIDAAKNDLMEKEDGEKTNKQKHGKPKNNDEEQNEQDVEPCSSTSKQQKEQGLNLKPVVVEETHQNDQVQNGYMNNMNYDEDDDEEFIVVDDVPDPVQ